MRTLITGLLLISGASLAWAESSQCERLFSEPSERATCDALVGLYPKPLPDDELRELVSQQVYGVSAAEADARRKKREEAERAAAEEITKTAEEDLCSKLYSSAHEKDVCRWYVALNPRTRSDSELRESVNKHLRLMEKDDAVRQSTISAIKNLRRDAVQDRVYEKEAEERRLAREREERAEIERTMAALSSELKRGKIGFAIRERKLSGFGTVMILRFWLQNNMSATSKDFVISCLTSGASGTHLSTARETLYESLAPKQRKSFELNMGLVHPQSVSASCGVARWK